MKIKTADLIGPQLDWAVELAKGTFWSSNGYFCFDNPERYDHKPEYSYSTDWEQGGPIIDLENISVQCFDLSSKGNRKWNAYAPGKMPYTQDEEITGSTPLIAAMRCLVASKLGEEVEIPDELLKEKCNVQST